MSFRLGWTQSYKHRPGRLLRTHWTPWTPAARRKKKTMKNRTRRHALTTDFNQNSAGVDGFSWECGRAR